MLVREADAEMRPASRSEDRRHGIYSHDGLV